jgi:hypothetical protein
MARGILLLHDIQARTVEALPDLLHELKRRGYHIVHVTPGDTPAALVSGLLTVRLECRHPGGEAKLHTYTSFSTSLRIYTSTVNGLAAKMQDG